MRFAIPVIFLVCMIVAVSAGMSSRSGTPSSRVAQSLLADLRAGDITAAAKLFGDNTCQCPPKGGYITLLKYESGYVPNLAFLVGQKFHNDKFKVSLLRTKASANLPWEKPESRLAVTNITFDKTDMPFFLPLDMAYGKKISEKDLDTFGKDPDADGIRGFSLRLRPTLKSGLIGKPVKSEEYYLLPEDVRRYLHPSDAGPVISENKGKLPVEEAADRLPRLKSTKLYLTIVRRGELKRWTVKEARFGDAELVKRDGTITRIRTGKKL